MNSMNAVAAALSLPPANVLYTPTQTPQQQPLPGTPPIHSPLLSPRQRPFTPPHPFSPGIFSPPGHLHTPPIAATPPIQPAPNAQPFPFPLSPPLRAPVYQKPPLPISPRATLAPHVVKSPTAENPRTPTVATAAPRRAAPLNTSSAYVKTRAFPREAGSRSRAGGSGRRSSSSSPKNDIANPMKHTSNVTDDGLVTMTRSVVPDAPGTRLVDENTPGQSYDEGLGLRKFSAVTQEGSSAGVSPMATWQPGKELDVSAAAVQESTTMSDLVQRFDEGSNNSKRSSEEFYTPKETISPEQQSPPTHAEGSVQKDVPSQPSAARPPKYSGTQGEFSTGNVDEFVRQSVTDSVITQFSKPGANVRDQGTTSATSSVYGPESYRSVDFSDPRFMQTSTLDAPSPSNHWNMSHRKDHCEGILSPQPLFSPPHMPQRLRKSTASTQMTPPIAQPQAPNLFRSGSVSSQYSFSSAGDNQDTGKQNVPSATASRDIGTGSAAQTPTENIRTHEQVKGFSLPPSAGSSEEEQRLAEDQNTVPSTVDEDDLVDHERDIPQSELEEEHPMASPEELQVCDDREFSEDHEYISEGGDGSQDQNPLPDEEDNSLSDNAVFEEVEEYAVYSSDHQTDDFFPPGEDEPQFVHEEVLRASSGEFDIVNESEGQTGMRGLTGQKSVERIGSETGGISQPAKEVQSRAVESEEIGDSRIRTERVSEPTLSTSARPPRVTRPMSFSSPAYGTIYRRSVPPTPPSPPAIESLVRSFTDPKRLPESIAVQPVSTMEPSEGLFQKLISVWQNTDDDQRTELSQSQIVVEGLPSQPVASDPAASQSTQDSTLHDSQSQEASPSLSASRGRRPRAVRLPDGLKSPQHLSSSVTREDSKSPECDKASIASFSDDFNSEDRVHAEAADVEWEEALSGRGEPSVPVATSTAPKQALGPSEDLTPPSPSMVKRKAKSHSTSTARNAPVPDDHLVKVDRRRLDWLTRQLLSARDAISRRDLQMTFAQTERADQREILLLEKQDAESVIEAMKKLLADREAELLTARNRLSVAIEGVARDRASHESKTSSGGDGQSFHNLITEGHTKIHERIERSEVTQLEAQKASGGEMKELLADLQRLLTQAMDEMTETRDAELNALRTDLRNREQLVSELQKSSAELMSQNREIQSEASQVRLEKERSDHRYKMEMSHVSAQVELVNEFSKKLHDNFRETENLRQQVLHYQDKLSQISSTSGVSRRQIKELREAVTRANDECARLRREADAEKRKRMEAIRRAEELEDLRMNDDAAQSHGRYPDRMDRTDSGSFRSHEPVRPAGHNRPGGSGMNARYHARARGAPASPTTAQRAWLAVKDKISGIVTGKDMGPSRRRGPGHSGRRDYSKGGGSSQSSHSQTRSRGSPRDEFGPRSRSGSLRSRSSQGSGSSVRSGQRSNRSGGSGGRRTSPGEDAGQYMHTEPYGRDEIGRIRAADF